MTRFEVNGETVRGDDRRDAAKRYVKRVARRRYGMRGLTVFLSHDGKADFEPNSGDRYIASSWRDDYRSDGFGGRQHDGWKSSGLPDVYLIVSEKA